jgi:PAS domain S-box-containing protein
MLTLLTIFFARLLIISAPNLPHNKTATMTQKETLQDYFCDNWKGVVENMKEGLMLVTPSGQILYANYALEKMLGYEKNEMEGKSCNILECDNCLSQKAGQPTLSCTLFLKGDVQDLHCILRCKDGTRLNVLKNATVLTNAEGQVVAGVETVTDLSSLTAKEKTITDLRKHLNQEDGFHGLIGNSLAMRQVYEVIRSAAQSTAPVIIYGESGTGKELVSNAIHRLSDRKNGPFIKVNCAALNENLLESELFGHAKGAFAGADKTRIGRFEAADHGTILLDEVGDLPLSTQTKLLRVLQEHEIERVGDHQPVPIDVRLISATNQDLNQLMDEGKFRNDFYYRIGVIPIIIPPLRQRLEDLPLLIKTFLERGRLKNNKEISAMNTEALDLLFSYHWPGNIRELINVIDYCFVICPSGEITPDHLPANFRNASTQNKTDRRKQHPTDRRQQLLDALHRSGENKSEAARILGISRVTLWKQLKKHNITVNKAAH